MELEFTQKFKQIDTEPLLFLTYIDYDWIISVFDNFPQNNDIETGDFTMTQNTDSGIRRQVTFKRTYKDSYPIEDSAYYNSNMIFQRQYYFQNRGLKYQTMIPLRQLKNGEYYRIDIKLPDNGGELGLIEKRHDREDLYVRNQDLIFIGNKYIITQDAQTECCVCYSQIPGGSFVVNPRDCKHTQVCIQCLSQLAKDAKKKLNQKLSSQMAGIKQMFTNELYELYGDTPVIALINHHNLQHDNTLVMKVFKYLSKGQPDEAAQYLEGVLKQRGLMQQDETIPQFECQADIKHVNLHPLKPHPMVLYIKQIFQKFTMTKYQAIKFWPTIQEKVNNFLKDPEMRRKYDQFSFDSIKCPLCRTYYGDQI